MRRFVRSIIPMAITAAVTHFLMFLILGDILFTVACALVGQKWAALPYTLFLFLLQVGAILIVWRVRKPRDSEARREYLNLLGGESQKTFGGGQHALGVSADTHGEAARYVHTDVLAAERIGQVGIDADGGQAQISIILDDGPYKGTASVDTLGALVGSLAAVDDQNLV